MSLDDSAPQPAQDRSESFVMVHQSWILDRRIDAHAFQMLVLVANGETPSAAAEVMGLTPARAATARTQLVAAGYLDAEGEVR